MSAIKPVCDACAADLGAAVYHPRQSKRGVSVACCPRCGLVQSVFGEIADERVQALSTDADWGNVRHGKGLRFEALRPILEERLDWTRIASVLDIGSNRGDFVRWLSREHPDTDIWAVEPDTRVIDYRDLPRLNLIERRMEQASLPDSAFDLVYSCHTLEHAASATAMMEQTWRSMKEGGHLLLEVPNIQAIGLDDIVEEFFIDKHPFHFDPLTLGAIIEAAGFEILWCSAPPDRFNLTFLARKTARRGAYLDCLPQAPVESNRALIETFERNLDANRGLLRKLVDEKLRPLAKRQKVAYWGAGRIFDALVKYGGLERGDVHILVDKHLHKVMRQTQGFDIERPERLRLKEPQVIVVLARSGEDAIAARAYAMGIRHVLKFSELIEQVREDLQSDGGGHD